MRISKVLQRIRKPPKAPKEFGVKDCAKIFVGANIIIGLPLYSHSQYEKGFRNSFTNFLRQPVVLFFKVCGIENSSKPDSKTE